jgi:hypothetical protein
VILHSLQRPTAGRSFQCGSRNFRSPANMKVLMRLARCSSPVNALLTMAMHLASYGLSNRELFGTSTNRRTSLWLAGAFQRAELFTTTGVVPMEDQREFAPEILFVVVWSAAILYFVLMSY